MKPHSSLGLAKSPLCGGYLLPHSFSTYWRRRCHQHFCVWQRPLWIAPPVRLLRFVFGKNVLRLRLNKFLMNSGEYKATARIMTQSPAKESDRTQFKGGCLYFTSAQPIMRYLLLPGETDIYSCTFKGPAACVIVNACNVHVACPFRPTTAPRNRKPRYSELESALT